MDETSEYKFTKEYLSVGFGVINLSFWYYMLFPTSEIRKDPYGKIYGILISCIFLLLIGNRLYIIFSKKNKLPSLIINSEGITISKWYLMRYKTIKFDNITAINEIELNWDNRIEIVLEGKRKKRISLSGYSDEDKRLISDVIKEVKRELSI